MQSPARPRHKVARVASLRRPPLRAGEAHRKVPVWVVPRQHDEYHGSQSAGIVGAALSVTSHPDPA